MSASKLSTKSQVTLPKEVRDALGARPGDTIVYEIGEDKVVRLRRLDLFDAAFHKSLSKTMGEWASQADEEAFGDL